MLKFSLNEEIDVLEEKIHNLSPSLLKILIEDKTTNDNLRWATNSYKNISEYYNPGCEMQSELLIGSNIYLITPRVSKSISEQQLRTNYKGEVFTPAWMCNLQNNYIDENWFNKKNAFNFENINEWKTNNKKIVFSKKNGKSWEDYVADLRLEIACGEAPYLVSRYDVVSGKIIPVQNRIGILDRKLRVVNENVNKIDEWINYVEKAYESTYGYDYQGDNVLIARENLLYTFIDNYQYKFHKSPEIKEIKRIANIIVWNIWQMDGLDYTVPYSEDESIAINEQISLFDEVNDIKTIKTKTKALIRNWKTLKNIEFEKIGETDMKFDYIVGNPPYQLESEKKSKTNGQTPRTNIFHYFQIQADRMSEKGSCLIYPGGRWIHYSGKGVEKFGKEQINDRKMSVLKFYPDSKEIFGNSIEDGLTVVVKNKQRTNEDKFKYIYCEKGLEVEQDVSYPGNKLFSLDPKDTKISLKIQKFMEENNLLSLNERVSPRNLFGIESDFVEKNPRKVKEYAGNESLNFDEEIKLFTNDKAGKKGRAKWYVTKRNVIKQNIDLIDKYKVVVSSAKPGGHQGRSNQLEVIDNHSAFGRSRVAVGIFETESEANNMYKYMNSNFVKYSLLLTDQSLTSVGKIVPDLEDYSKNNKLIKFNKDIDEQMYKLLKLNNKEIKQINEKIVSSWNSENCDE